VTNNIELSTRIKVCVIDTGLDERHPAIQAAKTFKAIKERRSFMVQSNGTEDFSGHGTHMVELILKSSANVEIYIAKIADDATVPQDEIEIIADVSLRNPL
jgi:subtilisin family serine protease